MRLVILQEKHPMNDRDIARILYDDGHRDWCNTLTGRPIKTVQTMSPPDTRQAEILPEDTEGAMFL